MYKIISVLLCLVIIVSVPFYCLADEETTVEETTTEISENISETQEYETEQTIEQTEDTTTEEAQIRVEYWLVPMSSQIKICYNNDDCDLMSVYISEDNESFEVIGETEDNHYIVDNLKHRTKYYIRIVVLKDGREYIGETQSVRVK